MVKNKRATPEDCEIYKYTVKAFVTTQGTFSSPGFVYLMDLVLPKFTLTHRVQKVKVYIFDAPHLWNNLLIYRHSFFAKCRCQHPLLHQVLYLA
jgi:hypothetical protein